MPSSLTSSMLPPALSRPGLRREAAQLSASVEDCLRIAPLDQAQVVAGHGGLSRRVHWVHVVDHRDMEDSLDGNELLLTSGIALANDAVLQSEIFEIMDRKRSAGLVISIGQYMADVPEIMRRRAEEFGIPVLTIPWEVNFVDITRVLLTQLVQAHYRFMELSQKLNQELLDIILRRGEMKAICDCISRIMETGVAICDDALKPLVFSPAPPLGGFFFDEAKLRRSLSARLFGRTDQTAGQLVTLEGCVQGIVAPICVAGRARGFIILEAGEGDTGAALRLGEMSATIAALAVAREEELLNVTRQTDARLLGILEGAIPPRISALSELGFKPAEPLVVVIVDFDEDDMSTALDAVLAYLKARAGAVVLTTRGHSVVGLLQRPKDTSSEWAAKLDKHLSTLGLSPEIGISGPLADPADIAARYNDVKELLRVRHLLQPSSRVIKAEHSVAVLQTLRHIAAQPDIRGLCPAITKIQEFDRSLHGSLIEALACLLEVDGNISLAARRLGIHRHTILYRINRISEILGTELNAAMRFELRLQLLAWGFAGETEGS